MHSCRHADIQASSQANSPSRSSDGVAVNSLPQKPESKVEAKKKEKDGKRKHDDSEYLERRSLKKEKEKRSEKEKAKSASKEASEEENVSTVAATDPSANH